MAIDPLQLGIPPGTVIEAVALTPGDHLNLARGDNWIIDPPAAWVAAQGQTRLDRIAAFQAAGHAVQPDLLYRPRRLGSHNPRLNRAPNPASLRFGTPIVPGLPIYYDNSGGGARELVDTETVKYSLISLAAYLHDAAGATWLASLRLVNTDASRIDGACLFTGQAARLRVTLTPVGIIDGAAAGTGYAYQSNLGYQFVHPYQGIAGSLDLADLPFDLGRSATSFDPGIGSLYYLGYIDLSAAGLAILDQKDNGRTILMGVLVNHARSGSIARPGWAETAWLRAVLELSFSQDAQGTWGATLAVLHTPATLESASALWRVTYQDGPDTLEITGTGATAPTPTYLYSTHRVLSTAGEHLARRALTAYYQPDGAVRVRSADYTANSLQTHGTGHFTYHQDELLEIVENGAVLSSLDSVADCTHDDLYGLSGCAPGEDAADVMTWRMQWHEQANVAWTGRLHEGAMILTWATDHWALYGGGVSSGTCGDADLKRVLTALPESDYPVDVIMALSVPAPDPADHLWLDAHYGGPIYGLWALGGIAWVGQRNSIAAPSIAITRHVLQLAGGDSLHADQLLLADIAISTSVAGGITNYHVLLSRLDCPPLSPRSAGNPARP